MQSRRRRAVTAAIAVAIAAGAGTADAAPVVKQLVVFRSGSTRLRSVRAEQSTVKVHGDRCAVAAGTPLAALARSRVGTLRLHDYGYCSSRPQDGGGLFVRRIGQDANHGTDGWVYKVGTRLGTAGAADPSGPFGHGRLRSGARVTWFYCVYSSGARSCQRTLALRVKTEAGAVIVRVVAYDDHGGKIRAAGVRAHVGHAVATTDSSGAARLAVPPGRYKVYAEGAGFVRSFTQEATVE
jgi:hypothetical protein